jgi:hypothetical protein
MNIDIKELLVFDNVVQEISKQYNLPSYVAAHRLFNEIRDYRKIGGMKTEISRLCQQAFVVNEGALDFVFISMSALSSVIS